MTDTASAAPSDAEIIALADETRTGEPGRDGYILPISFARAVLAKWGTPPAVAGEPVAWMGTYDKTDLYYRKPPQADVVPLYATPQPTQAQSGAVPLTDEQMYEARRRAASQLFDLAQQWADNKIHSYQFANEAEKIVNAVARRVEAPAHSRL